MRKKKELAREQSLRTKSMIQNLKSQHNISNPGLEGKQTNIKGYYPTKTLDPKVHDKL